MSNLGFDNYVEPLKLYLQKYREVKCLYSNILLTFLIIFKLQHFFRLLKETSLLELKNYLMMCFVSYFVKLLYYFVLYLIYCFGL